VALARWRDQWRRDSSADLGPFHHPVKYLSPLTGGGG
jgi:hypothetical protein